MSALLRQDIEKLTAQLKEAYGEVQEQARLLGMSAERELSLQAEIAYLVKVIAVYHSHNPELAKTLSNGFSNYGQWVGSQ